VTLVLASGSETRAKMLRDAGVAIEVVPSSVNEDELKAEYRAEGRSAAALADALAEAKAREVSARMPGRLVLGADQVLAFEGETFDKPKSRDDARDQMKRLRGESHELISAAVVMRDGTVLGRCDGTVKLTMRRFSDTFLEGYLNDVGDAVLWSAGGYQIEGRGAQLFEKVEGDYFSILGLPLFDVLAVLRCEGVMTE